MLRAKGDQVQWGGRNLYADGRFATSDGKAHFAPVRTRRRGESADKRTSRRASEDRTFLVSTRRGKQFNSMVQREIDPLTGASRDEVLISQEDLDRLRMQPGARVRLRSASGSYEGRLRNALIRAGNLEVHWPEGNILLSAADVDPESMEPDYNASVTVESLQDE